MPSTAYGGMPRSGRSVYQGPGSRLLSVMTTHTDFSGDGRADVLLASPWGIGILGLAPDGLRSTAMAANGSGLGGWNLQTRDNRFGPIGRYGGGAAEVVVTSPWGLGILRQRGPGFDVPVMAATGTRLGGWVMSTTDNVLGPAADLDGDGRDELVVTSPWGLGVLARAGDGGLTSTVMAANGTRLGEWLLNTADNDVVLAADLDGDGRDELVVVSPWGLGVLGLRGDALTSVASNTSISPHRMIRVWVSLICSQRVAMRSHLGRVAGRAQVWGAPARARS